MQDTSKSDSFPNSKESINNDYTAQDFEYLFDRQAILSAIVESSDDAIISKTLKGIIISWNKGAQKIFGYTEREILGKHISILIPPYLLQEEEIIIQSIKSGQKIDHYRTVRLTKAGKEVPISLTVSPVKDKSGTIIGASKIARDISEQVSQEQAIKELSAKKDEFIALAGHELRTPLTTIRGYLQILEKSEKDKVGKIFIEKAIKQSDKLNKLISELLDISKVEADKLQLYYETFDIRKLILDIIETFHYSNSTHQIVLENNCHQPIVEADKGRIEQVIVNLFSNAIKYSSNTNKVFIRLSNSDTAIIVCIKDEGIGLSNEQQEKLFTKFYRVGGNPNVSGLGIGLYITKEIIERHQGHISVISELGKGSEFLFSIPLKI